MRGNIGLCIGCNHPVSVHLSLDNDDIEIIQNWNSKQFCLSYEKFLLVLTFYLARPTSTNPASSSSSMSLSSTYLPPRSLHLSEEVKFQRQRVDPTKLKSQLESPSMQHSIFNTLTTLGNTATRPIQRSVGLYFYRRGLKAGFHGSPTLLTFTRTERIADWQQYLKDLVLQHPAWLSYPNIKTMELHSRLPICVGFWDGTTTGIAPNANILENSGIISDLLHLTDSPKASTSTQTYLTPLKGSRSVSSILRMALTIHIRPIGEESEDEDQNSQFSIKQEVNNSSSTSITPNPSLSTKQTSTIQSSASQIPPKPPSCPPETIIIKSEDSDDTTTSGSTTQEDTPSPFSPQSNNSSTSLTSHTLHNSSHSQPNRPATPTSSLTSSSILGRKRSLTLLSPQNITTRSTRELKRKSSDKIGKSTLLSLTQGSDTHYGPIEKLFEKEYK